MPAISELGAAIMAVGVALVPVIARTMDRLWPSRQSAATQAVAGLLEKQTAILEELLTAAHRGEVQRVRDEERHNRHFSLTEEGIKEQRQMLLTVMHREGTR